MISSPNDLFLLSASWTSKFFYLAVSLYSLIARNIISLIPLFFLLIAVSLFYTSGKDFRFSTHITFVDSFSPNSSQDSKMEPSRVPNLGHIQRSVACLAISSPPVQGQSEN